jgi:hypothetical protein
MGSEVSQEISFFSKSFFTVILRADKRSFTSLNNEMYLITYMESRVYLQAPSPRVPLWAASKLASERLEAGVCKFVCLEMSLRDKSGFANGTRKWALASVGAHMGLEISSFRKLFQTILVGTEKHLLFILWTGHLFYVIWQVRHRILTGFFLLSRHSSELLLVIICVF